MLPNPTNDLQQQLQDKLYFLEETAAMTGTGSYSMNVVTDEAYIDDLAISLLAAPKDFVLSTNDSLRFFVDKIAAIERMKLCLNGGMFERDVLMCDYYGEQFWARATGKPLVGSDGVVVGVKGVFTSIDRLVRKSQEAEQHARIIETQKDRLVDFAHIVSHNLRSHASNLQLTLETFDTALDPADITVFKECLKDISAHLNKTLSHLNTVVTTHTVEHHFERVSLQQELEVVLYSFRAEIKEKKVAVHVDFSAFDSLLYVQNYMRSILTNLISNAIRYKSPDRDCVINIRTKKILDKQLLIVTDNGSGINLEKHRDKVFKMYKTFHNNHDARGLGLFVVKNQVESLNGDISVKSELNKGTSFTIRF